MFFLGILSVFILITWINSFKIAEGYADLKETNTPSGIIDVTYYHNLENRLATATRIYLNANPKEICNMFSCTIQYSEVKENNYISELFDRDRGSECTGFVIVNNGNYNPFIKCSGYTTGGYYE